MVSYPELNKDRSLQLEELNKIPKSMNFKRHTSLSHCFAFSED